MLLHDLRLDLDLIRTARYGKIRLSHPDIPLDEIHHAAISYPAVHVYACDPLGEPPAPAGDGAVSDGTQRVRLRPYD